MLFSFAVLSHRFQHFIGTTEKTGAPVKNMKLVFLLVFLAVALLSQGCRQQNPKLGTKTSPPHHAVARPTLLLQNKVEESVEKAPSSEDKQQTLSQQKSQQKYQQKKPKVLDMSLDPKGLSKLSLDKPLNFSNTHSGISEAFKQTDKPSTMSFDGKLLIKEKEEDLTEMVEGAEVEVEIKY